MEFFIDTNVFLRFLLADNPTQSIKAKKIFEKAAKSKIKLITHSVIIAELIWTLYSFYQQPKQKIIEKIKKLLLFEGLKIIDSEILNSAIIIFEKYSLDFIDAFAAAWVKQNNLTLVTFDKDFDKIENFKCLKP